jgi:hypothetical protein
VKAAAHGIAGELPFFYGVGGLLIRPQYGKFSGFFGCFHFIVSGNLLQNNYRRRIQTFQNCFGIIPTLDVNTVIV